jgi:hypothetical protein
VQLVDRLGELNRVFAATQISAAELKLASCVLIVLVLMLPFGLGGALRIVSLPLLAALCSLASLGWLGQPLTLFSLFGLLLVTAISVDYAILMREQVGGAAVSLLGTLLAALTTWLSFGLLAVSSTPAVSNFGLSVSLGLASASCSRPGRKTQAIAHRRGRQHDGRVVLGDGPGVVRRGDPTRPALGLIPIVSQLLLATVGLPLLMYFWIEPHWQLSGAALVRRSG